MPVPDKRPDYLCCIGDGDSGRFHDENSYFIKPVRFSQKVNRETGSLERISPALKIPTNIWKQSESKITRNQFLLLRRREIVGRSRNREYLNRLWSPSKRKKYPKEWILDQSIISETCQDHFGFSDTPRLDTVWESIEVLSTQSIRVIAL